MDSYFLKRLKEIAEDPNLKANFIAKKLLEKSGDKVQLLNLAYEYNELISTVIDYFYDGDYKFDKEVLLAKEVSKRFVISPQKC